jgi:hypothetical protein
MHSNDLVDRSWYFYIYHQFIKIMLRSATWSSMAAAALFLLLAVGSDDSAPAADSPTGGQVTNDQRKDAILGEIGRGAGYIYESRDDVASVYSTLAFDAESFQIAVYMMADGGELTPVMELDGTWEVLDNGDLRGRYKESDGEITWKLSGDRTNLTNDMGVRFTRIAPDEAGAPQDGQGASREGTGSQGGPVFGTFALEDASVAVEFTVMGDTWTSTLLIKTGMEAYGAGGEPSYDSGTVVGNDLYDATGNFVIGRVNGDQLVTSLGEQRVVLRRQ